MIGVELPYGHPLLRDDDFLNELHKAKVRVIGITGLKAESIDIDMNIPLYLKNRGFIVSFVFDSCTVPDQTGFRRLADLFSDSGKLTTAVFPADVSASLLNDIADAGMTVCKTYNGHEHDYPCLSRNIDDKDTPIQGKVDGVSYVRIKIENGNTESLEKKILSFSFWYYGHYMLSGETVKSAISAKIELMKKAMPAYAFLYDDVRDNFIKRARDACAIVRKADNERKRGTQLGLIQSTSYVFRTNGMPWAMDIALRSAVGLTNATDELPRLLSDVEYMLITHGHEDHFERETVQCLLQCRMKWVIPHFLLDMAHDFGLKDEQIIIVNRGQELHLGELRVMSFEGQHYRPSNHVGIDELGYCISAKDSPTLLFPGDTRDFSCEKLPHFDHVDWIFGHVWLGDEDSRIADRKGMDTVFANHLMHFNPQGAVLAHLYETSRNDKQMWRYCHAGLVADRLREISPDIKIKVPLPGEITDLPIIN